MYLRSLLLIPLWAACVGAPPPDIDGADDSIGLSLASGGLVIGGPARVAGTGGLGLRLRAGPDVTYAVLDVLPEGAPVTVLGGPDGPWYRVAHAGLDGWAHGGYLRAAPRGKNNLLPWTANTAFYVTQGHNGGSHTGLGAWAWDFGMPIGTPVRAAHFGTVRLVKGNSAVGGCSSVYGNDANFVIVDQGNGYESLYLHLSAVTVTAGQAVERGDLVGYSGQTGWSCGPHLHFQVQLSPSNGGGFGFYNPSIHDVFYDTGAPYDPPPGTLVTSQNGVSSQPRELPPRDPRGDDGAWDRAMQAASAAGPR